MTDKDFGRKPKFGPVSKKVPLTPSQKLKQRGPDGVKLHPGRADFSTEQVHQTRRAG